ncbi:hypothetical protein TNCV_2872571 [Trichonephila clavipes]|nr:hypothetical protein TNCV_2872571 [Trichonephila clavipes]
MKLILLQQVKLTTPVISNFQDRGRRIESSIQSAVKFNLLLHQLLLRTAIKVVLKGIPHYTKTKDIHSYLIDLVFIVDKVTQLIGHTAKRKLPAYQTTLARNIQNAKIFDLDKLSHISIREARFEKKLIKNIHLSDFTNIKHPVSLEEKISNFTDALRSAHLHSSKPITNKLHSCTPKHIKDLVTMKNRAGKRFHNTLNSIYKTEANRLQAHIKNSLKFIQNRHGRINSRHSTHRTTVSSNHKNTFGESALIFRL